MHFSILAAAAFAGSVSAHAVMKEPSPYQTEPKVQVNPLDGGQFKFPCQIGEGPYPPGEGQAVTAGENTPVTFTGSAVHGGGSCQFSVTYEDPPKADPSTWKVLYSIIGGCPASVDGNLVTQGTDPDGRADGPHCTGGDLETATDCVKTFNIPFPKEMKNGKATFAWTWFNKVGNREMYMNCAPITISGGQDTSSYVDTLPSMFVANIPGQCTTASGSHVIGFPDPGIGVQYEDVSPNGQGECPAAGSLKGANPLPGGGSPPKQDTPAPSSSAAPAPTSAPAPAPTPETSQPAAFHPIEEPAPEPAKPTTSFATVVAPSPSEAPAPEAPAPHAPLTALPPSSDAVACSNEGAIVCMDNGHFGLCNHGFALPQAVAFGTACENGKVLKRKDLSRHARRHLLHAAKHQA